ncbi:unnamed protein product [Rotaria socialis]|uniref:Uncharacterized protein n=1 Tax=Rotaria socialis TaxID=392032 RepID=A0A817U1D1_9BILA|nr:unnamed protein product [Rotaria socialis]CAF3457547.1 unnamed protein product [Rotaria socialis]CAF4300689.1 unnamed protein product [Rotaria socialis]CAF4815807.1 unnamed protein product [Rotaria socialis]
MENEYNSEGRLPIHEAAFRNYDNVVERILTSLGSRSNSKIYENEDNKSDDDNEHLSLLHRTRIQEMIEAITYDYFRLTPILAATVGNAPRTIECLISHGAKVTCRDGDNRSMAAIAIFKQNIDLFLYFATASYANELDLWNTLMTIFTSKVIDESAAAGHLLEQLTSSQNVSFVWPFISNLHVTEKTIQVLIQHVNNNNNNNNNNLANDSLLASCLIIFYNLMYVDPNIRAIFSQNEDGARALVKMRKTNEAIVLIFSYIVCHLCDNIHCIQALINQNLLGDLQTLLDTDTMNIPKNQVCLYFDILGKIARCKKEFQEIIQYSSATKRTILDQAIDLLERFDRDLTISILHFIRDLCADNEQQQQICADNNLLIAHLLSALNSTYKDVQRSSVDTLQMIIMHNTVSQYTILQQGGAEQLLTLLTKATLPKLRVSIISTLWSLTGEESNRRQSMAHAIGVSTLIEVLNVKMTDQLYIVLDAISELLRQVPTEKGNIPLKFGRRHCIPSIVRILSIDYERKLLLKCLICIQQLCLLPTYRPCRINQTIFQKANGFNQILILIRRTNKDKLLQAKAIATIACTIFDHKENKEILTKSVIQQLFKRISLLFNSSDDDVKTEAGLGLVTFVCSDVNYYNYCAENMTLQHEYFRRLLISKNIAVRCNAAFQMIILIRIFSEVNATAWIAEALMTLFRVIGDRRIDDEEKILPSDIIGRLARIPSGFGVHKHSGVCEAIITSDGLERMIALLNSSNILLHGLATVAIERLVHDSPEGQRRLLKQCRTHIHYLDILKKFAIGPSILRTRVEELYALIHHETVHFPPIRTS